MKLCKNFNLSSLTHLCYVPMYYMVCKFYLWPWSSRINHIPILKRISKKIDNLSCHLQKILVLGMKIRAPSFALKGILGFSLFSGKWKLCRIQCITIKKFSLETQKAIELIAYTYSHGI